VLWKGAEAWALDACVETDPERNRSSLSESLLEAGKQVTECSLAAGQQRMDVLSLRCTRPMGRVLREDIAL
jgi:uncharacterized membrane protein